MHRYHVSNQTLHLLLQLHIRTLSRLFQPQYAAFLRQYIPPTSTHTARNLRFINAPEL